MMKDFTVSLSCGAKLQVLQPEEHETVLLRLTLPDGELSNHVQIKGDRVTVAIDPVNLEQIGKLVRKTFGPGTFLEFIKNRYGWS